MTPWAVVDLLGLAALLLVGCAKSPQASTDTGVLRGTVSYRERVALPPDAVVEVRLSDVSRQDVAATLIAEIRIPSEGRQVPLRFELRYDPSEIQANRVYAVRAEIVSGGKMLFTTDTAHRVITQGNPTVLDLSLVRAGGSGERVSTGSAPGLVGSAWRLEDLGGAPILDRVQATLEFPEEGKAAGNGSCNRFFGAVEWKNETISFGPLASTRMACAEPVGNQEAKYLEALRNAERFTLEGSALSIHSKGMEKPLRFVRVIP
jgi:putative lipoprotein